MKNSKLVLAVALCTGLISVPAMAGDFVDCNINGLDTITEIKGEASSDHVFWARLGNNGKGNGGEAVDATFDVTSGLVTLVTCVKTEDEDTGGDLTLAPWGIVIEDSDAVPEVDPGKS